MTGDVKLRRLYFAACNMTKASCFPKGGFSEAFNTLLASSERQQRSRGLKEVESLQISSTSMPVEPNQYLRTYVWLNFQRHHHHEYAALKTEDQAMPFSRNNKFILGKQTTLCKTIEV